MEIREKGEELYHLASLLFARAARKWYQSVGLEFVTGAVGLTAQFLPLGERERVAVATGAFVFLCISYFLRLQFEDMYESAETMRRQSVLSETLGWPIDTIQFNEWKNRAGHDMLVALKNSHRPPNYYATKAPIGPRKLLEITLESSYWTRHLYRHLRGIISLFLAFTVIGTVAVIFLAALEPASESANAHLLESVFLFLPAVLVFDFLEWTVRLSRLEGSLREIQHDLERLDEKEVVDEQQVMRLVSEYNCQVANGFPIHPWFFRRWHDEIQERWDER